MTFQKLLSTCLFSLLGLGAAFAQAKPSNESVREGQWADHTVIAQQRATRQHMATRHVQNAPATPSQPRQRRFLMPAHDQVYKRHSPRQAVSAGDGGRGAARRAQMTPDERRALRQHISEANQGIYQRKHHRDASPRP